MRAGVTGECIDDFFSRYGGDWIIAGSIPGEDESTLYLRTNYQTFHRIFDYNLAGGESDYKRMLLRIELQDADLIIEKGSMHFWTRYSEDCALFYRKADVTVAAVFDGVTGHMDGLGGVASRKGAEMLVKYLDRMDYDSCINVMRMYKDECAEKIADGRTTALILAVFGKECVLFNKGDSYCFHGYDLVNEPHDLGSSVSRWLNSKHEFSVYRFRKEKEITLYSDGWENGGRDDVTIIRLP